MLEELIIKNRRGAGAKDYTYTVRQVAKYHEVSHNAVTNSRAYSKPQREKAKKYRYNFVTDKLDKLYAYHVVESMKWVDGIATGSKEEVITALGENLRDEIKYEVITKEIK